MRWLEKWVSRQPRVLFNPFLFPAMILVHYKSTKTLRIARPGALGGLVYGRQLEKQGFLQQHTSHAGPN